MRVKNQKQDNNVATARKQLVSLEDTPYYHCYVRCVRRAFICGEDKYSGKNYDHRRDWIKDKITEQINLFAIDLYIVDQLD